MQRFSNTSFGRTLLGSNFGGLLLEQTFGRHSAAFPLLQRFPAMRQKGCFLFIKVARLQSEFCAKEFFLELRIFLRKMLRNFPRNFRAFVLWVRKNPTKIPTKFPTRFPKLPCENPKKFTDELLQERRENYLSSSDATFLRFGLSLRLACDDRLWCQSQRFGWSAASYQAAAQWGLFLYEQRHF